MNAKSLKRNGTATWRVLGKLLPAGIILLTVLVVLLIIVFLPKRDDDEAAKARPPVNVEVRVVEPLSEIAETFDLHGVIHPNRVVKVAAEVDGRVIAPLTSKGAAVKADQPIVRLNDDIIKAELARDRALHAFHAEQYDQVLLARKRGVATQLQMSQAAMNRDTAKAALDMAQARHDRTRVLSPISGVLDERFVEIGQYVLQGEPVAEIVDIDTLKVRLHVPERDVLRIRVGQKVKLLPDTLRGTGTIVAAVSRIREQADAGTRTTLIEVDLPNADRKGRAGPIVVARLTRKVHRNAVLVPLSAVIPLEGGRAVYVVESGLAVRRPVRLGFLVGQSVHVVSGLSAGDLLIIDGQRYVAPGKPVRIVGGAPATQPATQPTSQPATLPASEETTP